MSKTKPDTVPSCCRSKPWADREVLEKSIVESTDVRYRRGVTTPIVDMCAQGITKLAQEVRRQSRQKIALPGYSWIFCGGFCGGQMMACLITDPKTIPVWPTWKLTKAKGCTMPRSRGRNGDDTKGFVRRAALGAMSEAWERHGLTPDRDYCELPTPEHIFEVFHDVFPAMKDLHSIRKWK